MTVPPSGTPKRLRSLAKSAMVSIRSAKGGWGVRLLPWRFLLVLSLQTVCPSASSVGGAVLELDKTVGLGGHSTLRAAWERAHRGPGSARLRGVPQVPLRL